MAKSGAMLKSYGKSTDKEINDTVKAYSKPGTKLKKFGKPRKVID